MSLSKSLGLIGFDVLTRGYDFIIDRFTFNSEYNTFTHARHNDTAEYHKVTVNAYKSLAKNCAKVKLLNDIEEDNRALDYNYEKYDITELVILINILFSRIDNYILCNKMGIKIDLEYDYLPFSNPKVEELQLLVINAIAVFARKSMKQI